MSEDKKSKKNGIEKLRKVLDDIYYKDLDSKDEKHIIALKSRLKESSEPEIIYKKTAETDEEEDSLKPNPERLQVSSHRSLNFLILYWLQMLAWALPRSWVLRL